MSTSQILRYLYSLDISSPDIPQFINALIQHDEQERYLSTLRGPELTRLVDFLDEVRSLLSPFQPVTKQYPQALAVIPPAEDVSRRCLRKLQAICGDNMTLPSSYTISGDLARVGDGPVAYGGFADVWEGVHCRRKVCIKVLRVTLSHGHTLTKVRTDPGIPCFEFTDERLWVPQPFIKEVIVWKRLRHPNVVSFIGVTTEPLQIVSEWMPNGTLPKYVVKNPGADRIGLVSVSSGIAHD